MKCLMEATRHTSCVGEHNTGGIAYVNAKSTISIVADLCLFIIYCMKYSLPILNEDTVSTSNFISWNVFIKYLTTSVYPIQRHPLVFPKPTNKVQIILDSSPADQTLRVHSCRIFSDVGEHVIRHSKHSPGKCLLVDPPDHQIVIQRPEQFINILDWDWDT